MKKIKLRQTPLTPKERQQKIRDMINKALASGEVDNHYWFICMIVSEDKRNGPDDDGDGRVACWPWHYVPVIPLSQDVTGHYADLLAEFFISANRRDDVFYPSLTTRERLNFFEQDRWYIWGELEEDRVCGRCGQVYRAKINSPVTDCDCAGYMRLAPEPAGFYRVLHSYVDGRIYERKVE